MFNNIYTGLNKLAKLSFKEEVTEKRFQKEYQIDTLSQNKFAMYATLISYFIYLPFSYFITPKEFFIDLILMLSLPILASIIFIFRVKRKCFQKNIPLNLFIYSFLISIPPIISLAYTVEYHQIYLNNYLLLIIGISIMYGAPFVVTFFALSMVNIVVIILLVISSKENSFIYYNLYYLGTAFIVTSISSYLIEKNRRKSYETLFKQRDLNIKIKRQDLVIKQQAKHAQMGEMISMIAHQWRQPLGAINSTIIGIKIKRETGKYDLDDKNGRDSFCDFIDKKHDSITKYTKFLSDTIDDFRNFFKPDKEKEEITITSPIKKALSLVEASMMSKKINIVKNFESEESLFLYQNELMQVILNILKNSEDNFIEKDIKNREIKINTEKKDNNLIIKISDNGGGIPKDILPDIFNPYFSTKDERNGTGLGLYMSKMIIEGHHNGKLSVKNLKDGVSFEIMLKGNKSTEVIS